MTPEERLSSMEARLDRLVTGEEQSHARHMAWLKLHRAGFRDMDDDLLDRVDQTACLLDALVSSQLTNDASLRAMQASVQRLTETFQSYLESRKPKDDYPLQT